MTKEKLRPQHVFTKDPWDIDDRVEQLLKNTRNEVGRIKEEIEKLTPLCPYDKLPSVFMRYDFPYAIYRCKNGHEFSIQSRPDSPRR